MRLSITLAATVLVSCGAASPEQEQEQVNWVCGQAFMIALREGETLISFDDTPPETDSYLFESGETSASIDESNTPPSDHTDTRLTKIMETGRDWPKFVSVAGDPKLADRVIVSQNFPANCGSAMDERDR